MTVAGGPMEGRVTRIEGLAVMASTALLDGGGRLYAWLCPVGVSTGTAGKLPGWSVERHAGEDTWGW